MIFTIRFELKTPGFTWKSAKKGKATITRSDPPIIRRIFASIEELENEVLRLQLDKYVPPFFVQKVFGRAEIVITTKVKIQ